MRYAFGGLVLTVAFWGCKSEEQPPPQTAPYQAYPPAPAATPAAPPTAAPPAAPAPAPAAPAPAAPATGLSQPSPMALACSADANCLTHRCNTAVGKCAWPCVTNNDCNPGNNCMAGACVPAMPAAPAAQ
jgi:hypothetical protein